MEKYTCPCCGFKTLDNEHDYDICEICFWEDDLVQFEDVDYEGGANDNSLRQAQYNYIEVGACQRDMLQHIRKPNVHDVRDENWKPLCSE